MAARIVKASNGRYSVVGGAERDGRPVIFKDEQDDIAVTMDWSRVLGSATISSAAITGSGISFDNLANTTTQVSFNVYGKPRCGAKLGVLVTLSDGQTMTDRISVVERDL